MSEGKYTPGPLTVADSRYDDTLTPNPFPWEVCIPGGRTVAECRAEGDARLYPAAPEMAEALMEMTNAIGLPMSNREKAAWVKARAALQKAGLL